jgi:hypothetical protein
MPDEHRFALLERARGEARADDVLGAVGEVVGMVRVAEVLVPVPRQHPVVDPLGLAEKVLGRHHGPHDRVRNRDRVAVEDALHDHGLARAAAAAQEHLGEPDQRAELGVELQVLLDGLADARVEFGGAALHVVDHPHAKALDRFDLRGVDLDPSRPRRAADEHPLDAIPEAAEPRDRRAALVADPVDLEVKKALLASVGLR